MAERAAFVFPGLDFQVPAVRGGEPPLPPRYRAAITPLLARASRRVGTDLEAALDSGGVVALGPLEQQAFTYAWGLGLAGVVEAEGTVPAVVAGHSLGVYAAVVAAGALSFDDGLEALVSAFGWARQAASAGRYGLAAITGLGAADLEALAPAGGLLRCVIKNNSVSHVFAGERDVLTALLAAAEGAGAKARWLDRDVPYHHPELLAAAAEPFRFSLGRLGFRPAARPVVSTILSEGAAPHAWLSAPDALCAFVARNLVTPIAWDGVVRSLVGAGVTTVFECGPGTALSRLGRLVEADLRHVTVKDLARSAA